MLRFILVNDRTPRSDADCALCCAKITGGYVREINTKFCYCSRDCFLSDSKTCPRTPCEGRVMKCDHCRGPLGPFVYRYWRMRFCSKACEAAYLARFNPQTRQKLAEGMDRDRNAI